MSEKEQIKIYHIEGRRSERIVWLLEELKIGYELIFVRGDLFGSAAKIRSASPDMPLAPSVELDGQLIVESGAIVDLILQRFGAGHLCPAVSSAHYAAHVQWMHFAEGTLAARVFSEYRARRANLPPNRIPLVGARESVQFAENFLQTNPWFGGEDFSAADIMMLFPLDVAFSLNVVKQGNFPAVSRWMDVVKARPAYQAMLAAARPDGMIGMLPKLKEASA